MRQTYLPHVGSFRSSSKALGVPYHAMSEFNGTLSPLSALPSDATYLRNPEPELSLSPKKQSQSERKRSVWYVVIEFVWNEAPGLSVNIWEALRSGWRGMHHQAVQFNSRQVDAMTMSTCCRNTDEMEAYPPELQGILYGILLVMS